MMKFYTNDYEQFFSYTKVIFFGSVPLLTPKAWVEPRLSNVIHYDRSGYMKFFIGIMQDDSVSSHLSGHEKSVMFT